MLEVFREEFGVVADNKNVGLGLVCVFLVASRGFLVVARMLLHGGGCYSCFSDVLENPILS